MPRLGSRERRRLGKKREIRAVSRNPDMDQFIGKRLNNPMKLLLTEHLVLRIHPRDPHQDSPAEQLAATLWRVRRLRRVHRGRKAHRDKPPRKTQQARINPHSTPTESNGMRRTAALSLASPCRWCSP